MDEMQLLREMADETPLTHDLAQARAKFMKSTARRPRYIVYGAAVIGLAAAIFAVFALIPPSEDGSGPVPAASADQVLRKAAEAALLLPEVTPRPDQMIYHKTQTDNGEVREDWLSADGTHDGLVRQQNEDILLPGCRNGKATVLKGDKPIGTEQCVPSPAYRPDLPTTGPEMLAFLKQNQSGSKGDLNALAKDILGYLNSSYLLPRARAAIFEAAAKIEGLKMRDGVKDAAGRTGIEISWDLPKVNHGGSFIVDPATYAYLGTTSQAQLVVAIVDKAGQRP